MALIGVFSDSQGDLEKFDQALQFLRDKGARRFFFAGGNYRDLDDWVKWKNEQAKDANDYTNDDFLTDLTDHLLEKEQQDRPAAFGTYYEAVKATQELTAVATRFMRTPEKGSLEYENPAIPKKGMDMLADTLCCMAWDKNEFTKEDMTNAIVMIHGNAQDPGVVTIGPRYFITPGKLSGARPTLGLIEVVEKAVKFSAFTLAGETLIDGQMLVTAQKKKMSVKG
jgi:hypothetical protein